MTPEIRRLAADEWRQLKQVRLAALADPVFEATKSAFVTEIVPKDDYSEAIQVTHAANQAALAHERELLELAERALQRARDLRERKLGSDAAVDEARQNRRRQLLAVTTRQLDVDEHEARLRQYQARLERARAALTQALLDQERSTISAPFSGFVARVEVAAGDQVKRADTLLALYPSDALEVRAKLPAPYQQELLQSLDAGRTLRATARVGGREITLQLVRVSGEADPSGIDGLFRIQHGAELLRLGSMMTLQLQRDPQAGVVAVPYTALYGNDRMYKLVDDRLQGLTVTALGDYTGAGDQSMLLVKSPQLQAGDQLVTTHLPLRAVADAITPDRLERVTRILHAELRDRFGLQRPRILVCGLNPHAGENGHLGHEEQAIITPVLDRLRAEHPGGTIVCVSHADPIKAAMAHALGTHIDLFQRIVISPASITACAKPAFSDRKP